MPWRNRFRDLALDFHAQVISQEHVSSALALNFCSCKCGWKHADRGMDQQSVHSIFTHGQLCVVEIIHVNGNTVGERRESWWQLKRRTKNTRATRTKAK